MNQPMITVDGVEIPDFGERTFPYAVIEVTRRCNLRCTTCFFFQAFQHQDDDIPEEDLLAMLRALQRRHDIKLMSWVGGEPLLRPRVVEAAADIFPTNIMFTNGMLGIPALPVALAVSLDGPEQINDAIRGKGVYAKVMKNLRAAPRDVFIQCVVTRRNVDVLEAFAQELTGVPHVSGVIFSIYVPQKNDTSGLAFGVGERDRVIDLLLHLKDAFGSFVLNEARALELAYSATSKRVTDDCDMKRRSLALDYRLQRRLPCCYGEDVDCDRCAAPTPFSQAARREADKDRAEVGFAEILTRS